MTILVADVGGTNSRLAVARGGQLDVASIRRFRNADFGSFYDVIKSYQRETSIGAVSACSVALAGPVTATSARLTNLDWEISVTDLKRAANCDDALLINDMTALGYSIGHLPPQGVTSIARPARPASQNGQYLVAGLGTGFNVCPVKMLPTGGTTCLEAEMGHVATPISVMKILEARLNGGAADFALIEDCFSGRGLSRLHGLMSARTPIDAAQIVANFCSDGDRDAELALEVLAEVLGALARELVLQYMPLNGLYFAGSVVRGLFDAGFAPIFLANFARQGRFGTQLQSVPVSLVNDDAAALIGCVAALGQWRSPA